MDGNKNINIWLVDPLKESPSALSSKVIKESSKAGLWECPICYPGIEFPLGKHKCNLSSHVESVQHMNNIKELQSQRRLRYKKLVEVDTVRKHMVQYGSPSSIKTLLGKYIIEDGDERRFYPRGN